MTIIKTLTKNEIEKALAKYFNLEDGEEITLIPYITTVGYGMDEHDEANVKCEIKCNREFE